MKSTDTSAVRPVRLSMRDLLELGMLGIRARKVRAALSALGISIGIATMVLVTAIPLTSQAALSAKLTALGTDILRVDPLSQGDETAVLPVDSVGIARRIGPVASAAVVANTHLTVRRSDRSDPNSDSGIAVLATSTGLLPVVNGNIASGSFVDDHSSRFPDVVLGYVAASRLGIDSVDPLASKHVLVGSSLFTVTGVLGPMPLSPDLERAVFIGWPIATELLGFDGHPTVVYVKAREASLEGVRSVLAASLYPRTPGLLVVSRPSDALAAKNESQENFSVLFIGLASVSLLVGGVGVANTMLISVLERRREIGLRRALGATRPQIRAQFLLEAATLSLLGSVAGVTIGVVATVGYTLLQGWTPVIPAVVICVGVLGGLAVGILAGIYPSVRASRLSPTEALSI